MKKLLIASFLGWQVLGALAQSFFFTDFEDGMPAGVTLIDNDGLTPSATMQKQGFAVGTPWIVAQPQGETNHAACSTSWYKPAGQSDDWLILPALTVSSESAVLRWRAMAADAKHPDGYVVYVATESQQAEPAYDREQPLFSTAAEEATWQSHTVSLAAYVGQTVRIAFVNNSTDCSRLYVDDILAGTDVPVRLRLDMSEQTPLEGDLAVSGIAYTDGSEPVAGFTIGLEYDGLTYTQQFTATLTADTPQPFTLDAMLPVGFHDRLDYSVWIESGGSRFSVESSVTSYPRHVVCEEGTGTWCGYCVGGLVMLDSIAHHYSDRIIGIAAHSGDPMDCGYAKAIDRYTNAVYNGYPCGTVVRSGDCHPKQFIDMGLAAFDYEKVYVAMKVDARLNKATREVSTDTRLWFAEAQDNANYRLGFVVVENDVHVADDPDYNQHNSYSGKADQYGPMGGYAYKPEWVPASEMWYQHVARGWQDDIKGVDSSVPTAFGADEELLYSRSFALPTTILDDANTELVVMLIDQTDGHIVNAVKVPLGDNMKEPDPEPYLRNVLIEEFTTEDCANCPRDSRRLQLTLAKDEYQGRAFGLCHHAGYHEDRYTQTIDRTLLAFYNDGGQTYAPGFMIDRMPYFQSYSLGRTCCVTGLYSDDDLGYAIDEELTLGSNATVSVAADYDATQHRVTATVSGECNSLYATDGARLSIFLLEDSVATTTQNGASGTYYHHHLIRDYDRMGWGEAVSWRGKRFGKSMAFTVDDAWNPAHLHVLAVLHHYDSTDILNCPVDNCAQADVAPQGTQGIHSTATAVGRQATYDLMGRQWTESRRADGSPRLRIVRMADGTVRKVAVR